MFITSLRVFNPGASNGVSMLAPRRLVNFENCVITCFVRGKAVCVVFEDFFDPRDQDGLEEIEVAATGYAIHRLLKETGLTITKIDLSRGPRKNRKTPDVHVGNVIDQWLDGQTIFVLRYTDVEIGFFTSLRGEDRSCGQKCHQAEKKRSGNS